MILDAKRGDIGSTAEQYVAEAFVRFNADAVTLNPYMGRDSAAPFLAHAKRGCIFLSHTSNPGARDFQGFRSTGAALPAHRAIASDWNADGNCAGGWRDIRERKVIRGIVGDMPLIRASARAGRRRRSCGQGGTTAEGTGLMINSSRGILHASMGNDYTDRSARGASARPGRSASPRARRANR